jgi:SOS response regulatory protein OraA/RecX
VSGVLFSLRLAQLGLMSLLGGKAMRDNPAATEKCIAQLMDSFDERTGKHVQALLDKLYEKGYTQTQICEALKTAFTDSA